MVHISVSSIELTPEDDPLAACKHLITTYYLEQVDSMKDQSWPPIKDMGFIQLALIKQARGSQSCKFQTVYGQIDEIIGDKTSINFDSMFNDLQDGSRVLLEGRPGSGKSTLMLKVSNDWAKGKILKKKLVFLVQLRRLRGEVNLDLHSLLSMSSQILSASEYIGPLCFHIDKQKGEGVVFALDGLDEYAPGTDESNLIYKLISKLYLPRSSVIVASRPAATQQFRKLATTWIEVVGFLKDQVLQYISNYFDDDKAQELKLHLKQHPNLMNMAYLPLHCAMLVFLFEEETVLPETETEFYKHFTLSTLLRCIRKRVLECPKGYFILSSFEHLPYDDKALFYEVCNLAFSATVASKQVFRFSELKGIALKRDSTGSDESSLGLVVIDRYFMRYGCDETYTFLHLTFQEYLAAVHIARLSKHQQMKLISAHHERHLYVVWRFLCGMMDFTSTCTSSMDTFKSLMGISGDILFQMHCCYESQHSSPCTYVINTFGGHVEFNNYNFSPSDCVAIGYVINQSDCKPVDLSFNECNFSFEGAVAILRQLDNHPFLLSLK